MTRSLAAVDSSKHGEQPGQTALGDLRMRTSSLSCVTLRSIEEFEMWRAAWDDLVSRSETTIFQTFDWQYLWWRHFGQHPQRFLHICVFSNSQTVVGIIPLFLEVTTVRGFRVYKRFRFLGCGVKSRIGHALFDRYSPTDYLDGIVDPGFGAAVAIAFVNYLRTNSRLWDEVELENLSDASSFRKHLLTVLSAEQLPFSIRKTDSCPWLPVEGPGATLMQKLRPTVRRRFAQAQRALRDGTSTISEVSSFGEIEDNLEDLIRLHQIRWNVLGFPGVFSDSRFIEFQQAFARVAYLRGWLWLKSVQSTPANSTNSANSDSSNGSIGRRVASRLAFNFHGTFYDYLAGLDDRLVGTKQRPGLGLLLTMIDDAYKSGCTSIDLLRGNELYKLDLSSQQRSIWRMRMVNRSRIPFWRLATQHLVQSFDVISYRFHLELCLVGVQFRLQPGPRSFFRYAGLRIKRLGGQFDLFSLFRKTQS